MKKRSDKKEKNQRFFHYNFLPKNRRGSHVGIVISFVIFVTFMVFLYALIKPAVASEKGRESILEQLELEIIKRSFSELTTASVNVASGGSDCVELDSLITDLGIGNNIIVKDALGQTVVSYIRSTSLQINRVTSDRFFKIYYSSEFDELETASSGCSNINYELGLTKTEEYIFEKKILELIGEYDDYETLKTELKIPQGIDFGFGFILQNKTTIDTNSDDVSTNIYIKETPVQYVSIDGKISLGYLKTKIW